VGPIIGVGGAARKPAAGTGAGAVADISIPGKGGRGIKGGRAGSSTG
jgi:hypothetical protein